MHQYLPAFREWLDQDPCRHPPRFVLREFERFLGCGVLSRGFARIRCPTCKTEEFPEVPVRQWVLTLPFELLVIEDQAARVVSTGPPWRLPA